MYYCTASQKENNFRDIFIKTAKLLDDCKNICTFSYSKKAYKQPFLDKMIIFLAQSDT